MTKRVILLVEDDPGDAKLTILALQKNKVLNEIVHVNNGEEALDYIFCRGEYSDRDRNEMPQLILLDLKMPKVDGFEVLEAIRKNKRTKALPVAVLTTSTEEIDRTRCYALGVNSYVSKPVDFEQFNEAVKLLGMYWLDLNIAP
jgi:two-component system, response regulator